MCKANNKTSLKIIAKSIQNKLLELGFVVHRYDSFSTNSIYLKLDYGASNSIRISDHKGKKKLCYRYNVMTDLQESYLDSSGKYPKYYYSIDNIDKMISYILSSKQAKIDKYGAEGYDKLIAKIKMRITEQKGFWQGAKEIKIKEDNK